MEIWPPDIVASQSNEKQIHTGFYGADSSTTQVGEPRTGHALHGPSQISGSPEHPLLNDFGDKDTHEVVGQHQFTAQYTRTIETVTIEPSQVRSFFTEYVSPARS